MSIAITTDLHTRIHDALDAIKAGRPVIVQDDHDRENEADLIIAADTLTTGEMARMIRDGSGIVCLCLTPEHANSLALSPMVTNNDSRFGTAFTITIEAKQGVTTGVSAKDRVTTIKAATARHAQPDDLARPGHIFPLIARPNGVLERQGHTESAVDLAKLAGLSPAGVLCELMNPDGTMMKGSQVEEYANLHGLPMLTVQELVQWRQQH